MSKIHNLSTVVRFEIVRALKKPSFWMMALGFPVVMAIVLGIVFMSNQATMDAADRLKDQQFRVAVTDNSGLILPQMLESIKAEVVDNPITNAIIKNLFMKKRVSRSAVWSRRILSV